MATVKDKSGNIRVVDVHVPTRDIEPNKPINEFQFTVKGQEALGQMVRKRGPYFNTNVAPANTVAPVWVDTTPVVGDIINASSVTNGTWTGNPTPTITKQYKRNGVNMSVPYTIVEGDAGVVFSCEVTGANGVGVNVVVTVSATAVPTSAPANTVAPVWLDTTPSVGDVISSTSVSDGTWSGSPTPTIAKQYKKDGNNISVPYTILSSDGGAVFSCVVTATNINGSAQQTATATAVPINYTTPQTVTIGNQDFERAGIDGTTYAYRYYEGDVHERYELRPGEKETWDVGATVPVERIQMDGWPKKRPIGWTTGNSEIDYTVMTDFSIKFIQGFPGGAEWCLLHEWHHTNKSGINKAPFNIMIQRTGSPGSYVWKMYAQYSYYPGAGAAGVSGAATTENILLMDNIGTLDGTTIHFREEIRFHQTLGVWKLWMNDFAGTPIVNKTNAKIGYAELGHYPQKGIYRAETAGLTQIMEIYYPEPTRIYHHTSVPAPTAPTVNILTNPSDFSNASWQKTGVTIANAGAANQALMETAGGTVHYVQKQTAKAASALTYRYQFDVTADLSRTWILATIFDATFAKEASCYFNISGNTIGNFFGSGLTVSGTPSVTDMGNGVKRCTMDVVHDTSTTVVNALYIAEGDNDASFSGDITKGIRITNVVLGLKP